VSNVGTITVQLAGDGGLPHACGEIAAQLRDEQDQRQRQDEAGDGIAVRRVRGDERSRRPRMLPRAAERRQRVGSAACSPPGTRTVGGRLCGRAPAAGLRPVFIVTTVARMPR
jgi:hypothetical protein